MYSGLSVFFIDKQSIHSVCVPVAGLADTKETASPSAVRIVPMIGAAVDLILLDTNRVLTGPQNALAPVSLLRQCELSYEGGVLSLGPRRAREKETREQGHQ